MKVPADILNQLAAYRGRIAPSPTGFLHLGHARTFWTAYQRVLARRGVLILRNEDLDSGRCRAEFVAAMIEDLKWFGMEWQEGPDRGGPFGPYNQSERTEQYRAAFDRLRETGRVYPCTCSRQDVRRALQAPHPADEEPLYPGTCRVLAKPPGEEQTSKSRVNWRFRVPDGTGVSFQDGRYGRQEYVAGVDFGDFVVWRHDDSPSYQLAVVVDDHSMGMTEVVRGADLLLSTARQILLYASLGWPLPSFYHCPLMTDSAGTRLAKRHDALSLRALRERGLLPTEIRRGWLGQDTAATEPKNAGI